ncbi:MAG: PAS domain S-box protein, partial [Candidatus Bathyarchaeota archaeon]
LRESEERFRSISTSAQDGIVMIDDEGNISYWNEAAERIFGYTKEEAIGKEMHIFLGPERYYEAYRKGFSKFKETGQGPVVGKTLELSAIRKGGIEFPVELSVSSVEVRGKWHSIGILRDITERKKFEEALRESEGKLNAMLQSIGDHMSMIDKDLNIIWANETARRIFGNDIIGKKCYEAYHRRKEPCAPYPCLTLKAFQDGKVHGHEIQVIGKTGEITYFHCTANVALRDEDGNPAAVIEISRDITEQKRAEEKLKSYQEQLRSLLSQLSLVEEEERRRIATELHDHTGQTLAYCKIKIGEMRNLPPSTDIKGALDRIRDLIDKTIQYTRSLTFDLSNPILYEVGFEAAVEWLGEKLQKDHGLMFHFNDDGQQKPLDDKTRVILLQVVRELLTNIIKHARARTVTVSVQRNNTNIQIDVKDDGVGFDVSKIDAHLNKTYSFGIFSIRERLQSIKGKLNIKSELGYGTNVTLTTPLNVEKNRNGNVDEHKNSSG